MNITLTALLGAFALPALAGAPAGVHFAHGDWEVACDNTRTCRAAGYHPAGDDATPAVSVLLERAGGPGQPVKTTLRLGTYDPRAHVPKAGAVTMHVDGRAFGQVKIGGDDLEGELTAPQTRALVAAVAGTGTVRWRDGGHAWTLSGQGAAAVLLKMDEFQGRLGTPGALLRKGGKDEHDVPPALPMPEVSQAPAGTTALDLPAAARTALLRELRGTLGGDCEAFVPDDLSVLRLAAGRLLVSNKCWAGAAGEGIAYWVANDAAPFKPVLVTTDATDYQAGRILASRGMGDCRENAEWAWDGRRFARTVEATTGKCRAVTFGGTWYLPTYVAKVTRRAR